MTPTEFVLWLNGAMGVMGDTPTPEQMVKIREQLGEVIGKITADRLLDAYAAKANECSQMAEITSGTVTASALARPTKSGGLLGSLLRPAVKAGTPK